MRVIGLIGMALLLMAIGVVVVIETPGSADPYQVRAVFDDAAFVVQGEEVRIAGAPVGTITGLDVCFPHGSTTCPVGEVKKAAVTLEIDKSGFTPWHTNAFCAIRPQSLIGEKYVDCNPGTASYPALPKINSGPGAGSYLLPVTRTSSPVDTDLVQDIYRLPVRQSLTIIINELGTGLATRGTDLNAVIHRANPALGYTDQVLKILARQNRQLAQLATDSAAVLRPLAKDRQEIAGFVSHANTTSVASAAVASDIARSIQLLPTFLRRLRPLQADLQALADQGTPLSASLAQAAPALGQQYVNLAPFAGAARSALIALGNSAVQQQPALLSLIPPNGRCESGSPPALACQLGSLGSAAVAPAGALDRLTASLDKTGAIQQLMGLLFYGTNASNGFDSAGHYVRDQVLVGGCTAYAKSPVPGCSANFTASAARDPGAGIPPHERARLAGLVRGARAAGINQSTSRTFTGLLRYLIGGSLR